MRNISLLAIGLLVAFQMRVHADEGMWLLSLIKQVNMDEMTEMGLQLTAEQIYSINQTSLKDAVGALDHGMCTAELVSPDGLLLTNHHCGYDEIQYHSSVEHDYLKSGFWAMARDEELPNEGKSITFLVRMEEVTDQIAPELSETMTREERDSKIRSLSQTLSQKAVGETQYEAEIKRMFNGNRFFLFITETYLDVRLVGAPPESIGKYGGDTDNWMWPRHTGDFSLFRVYTGPDGKPAKYSTSNVPLKSKHFLPISLKGYKKGDFTMVMGYPGTTHRFLTSWEIEELLEITHPNRIKIRGIKQNLIMQDMQADEKVRIQYASKHARSANYWKYSIGQRAGLKDLHIMAKQKELEKEFSAWVNENETRKELYGSVLLDIKKAVEGRKRVKNASQYLQETILRSSFEAGMESVDFARNLGGLERILAHPGSDQEDIDYMSRRLVEFSTNFYKDYNPSTDKKVSAAMIRLLMEDLEDEFLPSFVLEVKERYKGDVDKYLDRYFKKSFITDQEKFLKFMEKPTLKVLRHDPAYRAAMGTQINFEILGRMADINKDFENARRLYVKGLIEMHPEKDFYSDANSTMRMSYGEVGDYVPRDAVLYTHFTTLKGVMEKEDSTNFEFEVSNKLKELYKAKNYGKYGVDGRLNVCFTSNNDITGGNSGSPVINGNGELLGIAFDGNWESMSGDVAFEAEIQKCINVDIRYVMFIIDKYAGAGHLVKEMTLVP